MALIWLHAIVVVIGALIIGHQVFAVSARSNIGYFWHVTDFHFNGNLSGIGDDSCRNEHKKTSLANNIEARHRYYGSYRCDSNWHLVTSAVQAMKSITGENIEFLLWTGDSAARWSAAVNDDEQNKHRTYAAVSSVTSLLHRYFPGTAIYPIVGGADVYPRGQTYFKNSHEPYTNLATLWSRWLPPEAEATFKKGGYYVIEQARLQLHLVALNTNFYSEINHATAEDDAESDPGGQFSWLETILLRARRRRGTVFIFGHVPPGIYERHYSRQALHWFQDRFNRKYLQLVQVYSDVIAGQFFGHAHTDSFRVIYDDYDRPISWILLAPAVSPREPGLAEGTGANNPAIRLVKFNTENGQVLDYTQYFLNLTEANVNGRAEWKPAYNFTQLYNVPDVNPIALHNIAMQFLTQPLVFKNYFAVNHMLRDNLPYCGKICKQVHFCSATQIDYLRYDDCIAEALLASSTSSGAILRDSIVVNESLLFIIILMIYSLIINSKFVHLF